MLERRQCSKALLGLAVKHMKEILAHPLVIFAIIGLGLLTIAFAYMKKIKFTTRLLTHMSLMLALSIILHALRLYHMPQGGSITLGAMLPIIFISYRYGPAVGFLTGFIYGMINLIQDPFIVQPVQVLFDYPLPFMALGLAGYFPKHRFWGAIIGVSGRFLCHFISGVAFFANYAPSGVSPYWYSLTFNMTYLLPNLIICLILLRLLPVDRLMKLI